ncbi:hypothetical protein [Tenacibaculum sp. 190524A02b]|uniref:hypothetical protein n=1 Tax=Tenacibaculum vairaonense TaxID=3137860 RepID=UPI0031FABDAA
MAKFRKKPVVIEAVQFTGRNKTEVELFVGNRLEASIPPRTMEFDKEIPKTGYSVIIPTREGQMTAYKMDWILKGYTEKLGFHFWVNENGYFHNNYEEVKDVDKASHSFCETPEENCTMNYCDDNGCQNRKRNLVNEIQKEDSVSQKV